MHTTQLTLNHTILMFYDLMDKTFENIVEKEENAGHQHFLLFPQYFLSYNKQKSLSKQHLICHL